MLLTGCGLFRTESCPHNTTRCSGDRVQTCMPDERATDQAGKQVNHWVTEETCVDDPQLGGFVCGLVAGRATCVPAPADGGVESDTNAAQRRWIRVRVSQSEAGARIEEVAPLELGAEAAPTEPAWGSLAAVSYQGSEIIDATLVPLEGEQTSAYAWVAGESVDAIKLVAPSGEVLSEEAVDPRAIGPMIDGSVLDPAREMRADREARLEKLQLSAVLGRTRVEVTTRMRELVDEALARVPESLLLLTPTVVLVLDAASAGELAMAAEVGVDGDAGDTEQALPEDFFVTPERSLRAGWLARAQELRLDFRSAAVDEYDTSTLALSRDIVGALVGTYVHFTSIVAARSTGVGRLANALPRDFPPELEPHLQNQYAQLLLAGESPTSAWSDLHAVAAKLGLAMSYAEDLGLQPATDEVAVAGGFASVRGASSPAADLTEYASHAAVPESWTPGPCDTLRRDPLDKLTPAMLVHASKLIALRGLGLLTPEALAACAGELRVSAPEDEKLRAGALVLHKPDGERIVFTEELEGIRQPYFSDEVQLSWKAQRAYLSASLSVGYRGSRPAVMRLQAKPGHEGSDFRSGADHGAMLAFTNPDGYSTSVALGGLVVVTDVRQDGLNAYVLMTLLKEPVAGTRVFPLLSAQVAKPTWGDAP